MTEPVTGLDRAQFALMFAIPIAYIALFSVLAIAVDVSTVTVALGYVSAGTWALVLVLRGLRGLRAIAAGTSGVFNAAPMAAALLGLVASLGVAVMVQFGSIDVGWGVSGEIVVGAFAIPALMLAIISPD
jgi:hypothetical protein